MTFVKLFSSITESTIWCEDSDTRIVWITMLAMANKRGSVFGTPPGLANRARVSLECVLKALGKFQQPDKYSRTKENEGRRIEEIDGGWKLLNYEKHREIQDEDDRKEYMRQYMREYRGSVNTPVNIVSTDKYGLRQAEAEAEAILKSKALRTFVRPTLDQIKTYCRERGNKVDPDRWFDYYTANGFRVGRAVMRDWRAAVRTWERNGFSNGGGHAHDGPTRTEKRVAKGREAILAGLGISAEPRPSDADIQDGTTPRRGSGMARVLPE